MTTHCQLAGGGWGQVVRALGVVEALIRAESDELAGMSGELARALLHVQCSAVAVEGEEGALEGQQRRALVALLVKVPEATLGVLLREAVSAHLDVSQRLLILEVMEGAPGGRRELRGLRFKV